MKSFLSIAIKWAFIFPIRWTILRLPIKTSLAIGEAGGLIYYFISPAFRNRLGIELRRIFFDKNEKEIKKIIINTCKCYIQTEIEDLLYSKIYKNNVDQIIEIEGLNNLEKALQAGKGVILLHAHFGNPKMLIPALGYIGLRVNQIGLPPTDTFQFLEDAMNKKPSNIVLTLMKIKEESEKKLPVKFIYLHRSIQPVIDCLKKNEILALSIDGGRGKMVSVNFMGRKGAFMTGPIRLALKTGSVVLPVFVRRKQDNTHILSIEQRLFIDDDKDKDFAIKSAIEKFVLILEDYMKRYPCHYARGLGYNAPPFNVPLDS